jgi:hypothetical protein
VHSLGYLSSFSCAVGILGRRSKRTEKYNKTGIGRKTAKRLMRIILSRVCICAMQQVNMWQILDKERERERERETVSNVLSPSLCISLSLSHTHTHTHSHPNTHPPTYIHSGLFRRLTFFHSLFILASVSPSTQKVGRMVWQRTRQPRI